MRRIVVNVFFLFLALTVVAGCRYTEPAGNLAATRVTWIDYLDGGDIRRACRESGGPERYRAVLMADAYGAGLGNQARGFDLTVLPDGSGRLAVTVDRGITFTGPVDIRQIGGTPTGRADLAASTVDRLRAAFVASGALDPPPVGLRLSTREHFWILSGCRGGDYFLTAFAFPAPGWTGLTFPAVLAEIDPLAATVAWPRPPQAQASRPSCPNGRDRDGPTVCYTVHIGADGLVR